MIYAFHMIWRTVGIALSHEFACVFSAALLAALALATLALAASGNGERPL